MTRRAPALAVAALAAVVAACNGRIEYADCGDAGELCAHEDGTLMCCIRAFPYCGQALTDCQPHFCCNAPPRRGDAQR